MGKRFSPRNRVLRGRGHSAVKTKRAKIVSRKALIEDMAQRALRDDFHGAAGPRLLPRSRQVQRRCGQGAFFAPSADFRSHRAGDDAR